MKTIPDGVYPASVCSRINTPHSRGTGIIMSADLGGFPPRQKQLLDGSGRPPGASLQSAVGAEQRREREELGP
ncbi:hypothetical protein CgunFtcFv8_010181 [Champsocephalus gunnari]|uniref:Uncharacterized protein n=1 Tax=Champsocephalus gunnari TaxID=52237 RepID=A0AAN8DT67_CHAGU|nr:hypothetical protein CgunFtcFv8_010181 [Champsocephalus gunnari]